MPRKARFLLSLSTIALLSACGGGDSGIDLSAYLPGFAAPAPIDIAKLTVGYLIDPNVADNLATLLASTKYANTPAGIDNINFYYGENIPSDATQDPLRTGGAAFAHATGLSGDAVVIAFSDQHVSDTHETINGRLTVLSNGSSGEHGTAVTSVALGNSANFIGTAPDATGIFGTFETTQDLADLGVAALAAHAVAWNNSWGYTNIGLDQSGYNAAFSGTDGQAYLSAIQNYAAQGVVVFAVDNEDTGNAGLMDGLPVLANALEAGWIAVANGVPTFTGDVVSSVYLLSSPCYESARWCIIADGSWNAATGPVSDYEITTGSSFAAPQVSGALALLSEAFPSLTPHELRIRLLASAEDDFFDGEDTVELADGYFKRYSVLYGMGYLDIEAALRPIGPTALAMESGTRVATSAPVLRAGTGFGDAVERALTGTDVAVRDALNAPFRMSAGSLATTATMDPQGAMLLAKSMTATLSGERATTPSALDDPFARFFGPVVRMADPDGLGSATVLLPTSGAAASGLALTRALGEDGTRLELGLKLARDDKGLMSLGGDQAATMASVTLGLTQDIGSGGFLALSGELGLTDLGGATKITDATHASFNAVKLTVGQGGLFARGDRFSVGVGMPVAIASGQATARLPVLDKGVMSYQDVAIDLAPQDRQIDLEMAYMAPLGKHSEMKLSLVHSDNFGNRAGVTDTSGALAFAFRF